MHRVQEKSLQYIFCITLTMLNTVPEFLARIIPKLHFTKIKNLSDTLAYDHGLACAVATGCYINDVLCQWEFRPPPLHSSHIFQTIFLKLNPEKDIREIGPHAKFGLCPAATSVKRAHFGVLLLLFCTLRFTSRSHRRTEKSKMAAAAIVKKIK